ncbi:fimbrial protein [Erwinia sorbitola]|uniref:Fimbrial protein n=1 Tax=Erwinia sorbitola TaxID=2681984 RepID=A0A6I6EVF5_9GAMM|nr:fimbrial protein [Erwinia sorbitola]QGU88562.1 fimbrial protein [Erwinia sorbitola]
MSNGTITFSADIIRESMSIPVIRRAIESIDPGPSGNIHVDMGAVSESQLSGIGNAVRPVMFEMRFDNYDASKVRVNFEGISSEFISGALESTNPAVAVRLYDAYGNILPINTPREYPLYPGVNVIRFISSLVVTGDKVCAGSLKASASYTLSYA